MLSADVFAQYHQAIGALASRGAEDITNTLRNAWRSAGGFTTQARQARVDTLHEMVREAAPIIAEQYGLAAGEVSAALWEDIYWSDTGENMEALISGVDPDLYFGDAAETIVQARLADDDMDGVATALQGFARAMILDYARRTQIDNTRRVVRSRRRGHQNARWMRVPTGDKTCAWCIMLASRGPVYATQETAGGDEFHGTDLDHFHAFCDCEIVSGFSSSAILEGYSHDEYKHMYEDARVYDSNGYVDLSGTLANMRKMYGFH